MNVNSFTIIVPIHKVSSGIDHFSKWINDPNLSGGQLILVHDSSDEESFSPIVELCEGLDNVIFIERKLNSPGLARNLGLEVADRGWVAFWDFDDLPNPTIFLELLQKTISEGNLIGVGSFNTYVNEGGTNRKLEQKFRSESPRNYSDLMVNPGLWRWVFARSLVGETRFQSVRRGEDQLFLAEIDAFENQITFFEDTVYSYFVGDEKSLSARPDLDIELLDVADKFLQLTKERNGKTALFSRVAFMSSSLTFVKRSLNRKGVFQALRLTHWIFLTIAFHPKVVPIIMRRHRIHDSDNNNKGKILDLYLAGGLGNQLFQLSFLYNFQEIAEIRLHQPSAEILELLENGLLGEIIISNPNLRITIVDHISWHEKLARNQSLRLSSHKFSTKSILYKGLRRVWINFLCFFLNRKSILIVPNGLGNDVQIAFAESSLRISIVGYFQSHTFATHIRKDLKTSLFNVIGRSEVEIQAFTKMVNAQSIILHLRLGDYLSKQNSSFGVVTDRYVNCAIEKLSTAARPSDVIMFSNDSNMAVDLLENLGLQGITPIPDDLPTIESLYLLSLGTKYIISNSTFSWWGAFLSDCKEKEVIAPIPWFKDYDENVDLIPSNWLRCGSGW